MNVGSRRIWLYWLLLLLPTLAVGGGVWWLLNRERARLDQQSRAAFETRRAAVEARARLIAENVALLVGDVQSGLMTTLREVPATGFDAFLDEWQNTNPLVRKTFHVNAGGRLVRPADAATKALMSQWLAQGAPWSAASTKDELERRGMLAKETNANVSQVQRARIELQDTAKIKNSAVAVMENSGWTSWRYQDKLHLFGWYQRKTGDVFGVEVELAKVSSRLGDVLPEGTEPGEAYELREAGGVRLQQKTASYVSLTPVRDRQPLITVPVSDGVLPGWEVIGFYDGERAGSASGVIFAFATLLAVVLMAAILIGGGLLLRQARLSEADALQKTSFVANVSHEFKTPLTTIRLYSELLEQGRVSDEAKRGEYLRTIGQETQRLARLVNNALDFSRLDQGRKKFALETVDLAAELTGLLEMQTPLLAAGGLALHKLFPGGTVAVKTDRDALGQIMLNLLDNAVKYAAEGGEVTVLLEAGAGGGARVLVGDRGPGVPLAQRERIFEKFHRVDDSLTSAQGGAGLGLSIARQLARGLGGNLRCTARNGGGAEFILELP